MRREASLRTWLSAIGLPLGVQELTSGRHKANTMLPAESLADSLTSFIFMACSLKTFLVTGMRSVLSASHLAPNSGMKCKPASFATCSSASLEGLQSQSGCAWRMPGRLYKDCTHSLSPPIWCFLVTQRLCNCEFRKVTVALPQQLEDSCLPACRRSRDAWTNPSAEPGPGVSHSCGDYDHTGCARSA